MPQKAAWSLPTSSLYLYSISIAYPHCQPFLTSGLVSGFWPSLLQVSRLSPCFLLGLSDCGLSASLASLYGNNVHSPSLKAQSLAPFLAVLLASPPWPPARPPTSVNENLLFLGPAGSCGSDFLCLEFSSPSLSLSRVWKSSHYHTPVRPASWGIGALPHIPVSLQQPWVPQWGLSGPTSAQMFLWIPSGSSGCTSLSLSR